MFAVKSSMLVLVALATLSFGAQFPVPSPATATNQVLPLSAEQRAEFEAAMKAKDYTRAETLLVDIINNSNPKSAKLLRLVAGVFFLDKKFLNTIVALRKAELLEPLDQPSRFTLAMSFIALGHSDGAKPELERLARDHPKVALYPYWLARLDYDNQKFLAAVEKLNKAISLSPEFMKAYDNLGLSLEALGKYDEAIRNYREAIRLNRLQKPGSPWPPLNLGILLLKLGKRDEAEACLREALEYDPGFAEPHYHLGMLLEKEAKLEDAIKEFTQAATLDLTYPEPEYGLARVYRRSGDMKNAKIALREFQKRKREKEARKKKTRQHASGSQHESATPVPVSAHQ